MHISFSKYSCFVRLSHSFTAFHIRTVILSVCRSVAIPGDFCAAGMPHLLKQPAKIKKYRIWGISAVAFSRLLKVRHFEKTTILQHNKMNWRSVTNFLYFCHSFLEIELYEKNEDFPADFGRFSGPVFLLPMQERPLLQDASHLLLFVQRHGR
jgi:hypothetical protein